MRGSPPRALSHPLRAVDHVQVRSRVRERPEDLGRRIDEVHRRAAVRDRADGECRAETSTDRISVPHDLLLLQHVTAKVGAARPLGIARSSLGTYAYSAATLPRCILKESLLEAQ